VSSELDSTYGIGKTTGLHPIITQLRRERQKTCTQAEMARRCGTSRGNISDWEYGRFSPTLAHLTAWADALGFELTLTPKDGAS
jgi:transcriptional regulator with XRE-family HTH domain